jgi:integral membrane sensor domain MASE1
MIRISVIFNLLLFAFIYFNTILSSYLSFLFLFLLVFVLLIKGKGPRYSDSEFDSCTIHIHVILYREGACTSSISADD